MKPNTKKIITAFLGLLIIGCSSKNDRVTNAEDYNQYLTVTENEPKDFALGEITFWQQKFDKAPNQMPYLTQIAVNNSRLFENTGDIKYLYEAEQLLSRVNKASKESNPGTLRSLARNYISQHRFAEALILAKKALILGSGKKDTQKLLFDVHMELGNYNEAKSNLDAIVDASDFDYLIRVAKWNDHRGDIKTTISYMEKALKIAEDNDNKSLKIWSYTNLGDFNGHAGNVAEAYDYYLKTLEIDPNNSYALKGIAWIAFSHEHNTAEAKRIISQISPKHDSPDFYLLLAEIAEYDNNTAAKNEAMKRYFQKLGAANYGDMYNKYNALIFADGKKTASKALDISKREVDHRPTAESYDLLAWSYYNLGDYKKALDIAEKHVAGKSFEPELNYHLAMIYKANNLNNKIGPIKAELLASSFELGPNLEKKIQKL